MNRSVDPWRGTRVLVLLHGASSSPRGIGEILRAGGATLDVRRTPLGDALPGDLSDHDAVVVFGGPMSVNDPEPWIAREIGWLGRALDADVPLLGICLGAQMLARRLGAEVGRHPEGHVETGFVPVTPVHDAGWGTVPERFYAWHEEGIELPRGSRLLASGERFPTQAFSYGRAVGLQFHPEADAALIDRLTTTVEFGRVAGEAVRQGHLAELARFGRGITTWLEEFLRSWLPPSDGTPAFG